MAGSGRKRESVISVVVDYAVIKLVNEKEIRCPTIKQLLECLLDKKRPRSHKHIVILLEGVRRKIEDRYGIPVCSVCSYVFEKREGPRGGTKKPYCEESPDDLEEAKRCLPGGRGRKLAGLYFPRGSGEGDLIYEEFCLRYTSQGMQETRLNVDRFDRGLKQSVISRGEAPGRLADLWVEHLGNRLSNLVERAIEKATEKAVLQLESKPLE